MKNKRRLRAGHRKADMQEAFALCLNQKRHDAAGNRVQGHSFDAILQMSESERAALRKLGWLGKTETRRT